MSAPLTTPSPYLRDGLLALVAQLRAHAEEAAAAQRDADAEVERLRAELADAQDHARARAREVAELTQQIRWVQEQAEALRPPSAVQQHAATGLMPQDGESDPRYRRATCAELGCTSCLGCDDCACHDPARSCQPDEDELPFNVVQAPDQVVAALTGGIPAVPDDPPSEPGTLVATHGPGETGPLDPAVTTPDPGAAHPVPNPPTPPAAPPGDGGGRHARPKGSRRTGGWPLIGRRKDEQDGDTDG